MGDHGFCLTLCSVSRQALTEFLYERDTLTDCSFLYDKALAFPVMLIARLCDVVGIDKPLAMGEEVTLLEKALQDSKFRC